MNVSSADGSVSCVDVSRAVSVQLRGGGSLFPSPPRLLELRVEMSWLSGFFERTSVRAEQQYLEAHGTY